MPRVVCVHEAAHAVVGHALALDISRVAVCEHRDSGIVQATKVDAADPSAAFRCAIAQLAGPAAELIGDVNHIRRLNLRASSDICWARANVRRAWTSHEAVAIAAATIVISKWREIVRVADVLNAVGSLDGASIARLCAGVR
jgi:hypothetical protein